MVNFIFLLRLEQSCLKQSWENHQQSKTPRNVFWTFFVAFIMQIFIFFFNLHNFLESMVTFGRTLGINDIYDVLDKSLIIIERIWRLCKHFSLYFFLFFWLWWSNEYTFFVTFLAQFSASGTDLYSTQLWFVVKD